MPQVSFVAKALVGLAALVTIATPAASQYAMTVLRHGGGTYQAATGLDPSLPTFVVIHGWQPDCGSATACNDSFQKASGDWGKSPLAHIAGAIGSRPLGSQTSFNMVLFNWRDAYTEERLDDILDIGDVLTKHAPLAGLELATRLSGIVPAGYTQDLHVIGHSAGSWAGAIAINSLWTNHGIRTAQLTILDAPMRIGDKPFGYSAADFRQALLPGAVRIVDNYYGTNRAFGNEIPIAGPGDGGMEVPFDHTSIHRDYYVNLIGGGAWLSPAAGGTLAPFVWRRTDPSDDVEWLGGSDNWLAAANWRGGDVPFNRSAADHYVGVRIEVAGSAVFLDSSVRVDSLALASQGAGGSAVQLTVGPTGQLGIDGELTQRGNSQLIVQGELSNLGNISIASGAQLSLNNGRVTGGQIDNSGRIATIGGGVYGQLMSSLSNRAGGRVDVNGDTLSIGASTTRLHNRGVLSAHNAGWLELAGVIDNGGVDGDGLIEASGGATVQFHTAVVSGGVLRSRSGGLVSLGSGSSFSDGTLDADGGRLMLDGAKLSRVTMASGTLAVSGASAAEQIDTASQARIAVQPGGTLTARKTLFNAGTIELHSTATGGAQIAIEREVMLSGGGRVTLASGPWSTIDASVCCYADDTGIYRVPARLINLDNTVEGSGRLLGRFENHGVLRANHAGEELWFRSDGEATYWDGNSRINVPGSGSFNTGLMEAAAGGLLKLSGSLNNHGGLLRAAGVGSLLLLESVNLLGGTVQVDSAASGRFMGSSIEGTNVNIDGQAELQGSRLVGGSARIDGSATVRGFYYNRIENLSVGSAGRLDVVANGQLNDVELAVIGPLHNAGTVTLSSGDSRAARLAVASPIVTLSGGGTVVLAGNGASLIDASLCCFDDGSGNYRLPAKLVNTDNTIRGAGRIVGSVANRGTIEAVGAGQELEFVGFANHGYYDDQGRYQVLAGSGADNRDGLIQARNGGVVRISGSLDNDGGTIQALGGGSRVEFANGPLQLSGNLLTGGSYRVVTDNAVAVMDLGGSGQAIETNAASITLSGAGAQLPQLQALRSQRGHLELRDGQHFSTTAALSNEGRIELAGAATRLDVSGIYRQDAGDTVLDGATLKATRIEIAGGELRGNGRLRGPLLVLAGATVSPGFSPGEIVVEGDADFSAGSLLLLEVAGLAAFDRLSFLGQAVIASSIEIAFIDGFLPLAGDVFHLISATGGTDFTAAGPVRVSGLQTGYDIDLRMDGAGLAFRTVAVPVPEPAPWLLMSIGSLWLYRLNARRTLASLARRTLSCAACSRP